MVPDTMTSMRFSNERKPEDMIFSDNEESKEPEEEDQLLSLERQYQGSMDQRNLDVIEIDTKRRRSSIANEDFRIE